MRFVALTRVLPASILVVGLLLTLIAATNVAARNDREGDQARAAAGELMSTQLSAAENELNGTIDQIDQLAHSLEALVLDRDVDVLTTVPEQVDAQATLARGSVLRAVFVRRGADQVTLINDDAIVNREIPLVPEGLSQIESGIWSNSLAYGIDTGSRAGAEIVILIDRLILVESLQPLKTEGFAIVIRDLPGAEPRSVEDTRRIDAMEAGPAGVLWNPSDGTALLKDSSEIFGVPVQLEVESAAGALWVPSSGVVWLVPFFGVVLSIMAAVAALVTVRTVTRAESERDAAGMARDAAAARFRASFERAPIGVVELGHGGAIVAVNPRFASQLGYATDELVDSDLLDLVDGEDRPEAKELMEELFDGDTDGEQTERRYRNRNGGAVWIRESMSVLVSEDGSRHVLLQAEDVSDERRARAELHRKALFDDLTGLPNRSNFIARVNRALEADRPPGDVLALMFVDLDKFKQVNDTLGHEAGDILLIEVADRLRRACRSTDTVARLGGDEFVVLCEGLPSDEVASHTAERFAEALREPMFIRDTEVPVTASIGLVVNSEASSSSDLLRQADQAMYRAKTSGRNQLVRFDIDEGPSRRVEDDDRIIEQDEVRRAVESDELCLFYQPVIDTDSLTTVGCDAFIRWMHPEHGLLAAGQFLPVFEEYGLLEDLDRFALKEGIAALARWNTDGESRRYMIFNLAPVNYDNKDFASSVAAMIDDAGIDPGLIVLERNETSFMNQTPTAVVSTRELRSLGVRISLDHFGTGSSSLNEVSTLEFDVLKVDRSFVRNSAGQQTYVLEALNNMADALDLKVIAEGIETEAELKLVNKAGITFAQGYLLGRPVDEERFVAGDYEVGEVLTEAAAD